MFLCLGECDVVGVMSAVGVITLLIAASVVTLKILLSSFSDWRCLDGSLALTLLSLMILTSSSSAIFVI